METNHNHRADTTDIAGSSSRTAQGSTIEQRGKGRDRDWLIEIQDSDGNDGTYEVTKPTEEAARAAAFAEHDRECGHGAYMWITSCEEQE